MGEVASTTRNIKFISKAGTYTAIIMSPSGDLFQEWDGSQSAPTVTPDWEEAQPVLYFVCTSSRVAEGLATPDGINFYFNNTLIEFDSNNMSVGLFASYFKKVFPSNSQPYYGLQFLKNIVVLSAFAPVAVKAIASVSYGLYSDSIQASYNIPIQKSTGNSYRVTIASGDSNNFVIRAKNQTCVLVAKAYLGGNELLSNLTYVWKKLVSGAWIALGATSQNITVYESDISTYGEFMVEVFYNSASIGTDVQGVLDATDPYDILPCPSPEDETIYEDASGNGSVTYTPRVVARGSTTKAMDSLFYFLVRTANGIVLNKYQNGSDDELQPEMSTTAQASYTVTRAQCAQAGGDVDITITAQGA